MVETIEDRAEVGDRDGKGGGTDDDEKRVRCVHVPSSPVACAEFISKTVENSGQSPSDWPGKKQKLIGLIDNNIASILVL